MGSGTASPGDKVVFEGYGGKVVESRGSLARIAKLEAPDKPLFVQGRARIGIAGLPSAVPPMRRLEPARGSQFDQPGRVSSRLIPFAPSSRPLCRAC